MYRNSMLLTSLNASKTENNETVPDQLNVGVLNGISEVPKSPLAPAKLQKTLLKQE